MNRRLLAATAVLAAIVAAFVVREPTSTSEAPGESAVSALPASEHPIAGRERGKDAIESDAASSEPSPRPATAPDDMQIVVNAAETPAALSGAVASIERADGSILSATSGADGVATLGPRPSDAVAIRIGAPGRVRRGWFADDRYAGGLWWGKMTLDLELGVELRGRVIDARDGKPLAGAIVVAARGGRSNEHSPRHEFEDRTTTAADGTFSLPGVPAERPRLSRSALAGGVTVTATAAGYVEGTAVPLLASVAPATDVVVRLERAVSIRGRVVRPDGGPAAGAGVVQQFVSRWGDWQDYSGGEAPDVLADDRGAFTIDGVATGSRVSLRAIADDMAPSQVTTLTAETDRSGDVVLTLRPIVAVVLRVVDPRGTELDSVAVVRLDSFGGSEGEVKGPSPLRIDGMFPGRRTVFVSAEGFAPDTRQLDVPATAGETFTVSLERASTLRGVVVDDAGAPVTYTMVVLGPTTWTYGGSGLWMLRHESTEHDGTFQIAGVPSGDVIVDVPCHECTAVRFVETMRVGDAPVRIVLRRFGSAAGRVVTPDCGEPPKSCGIDFDDDRPRSRLPPWEGGENSVQRRGTVSGDRVLIAGLPPGKYGLSLAWNGYRPTHIVVDVTSGETALIPDIYLAPRESFSVAGRVLDPSGKPVRLARVVEIDADGEHGAGDTDAEGRFHFDNLERGAHMLGVEWPGFAVRQLVEVTATTPPVTLVLAPTRSVRISAHDAHGDPLVGRRVRVLDAERRVTSPWEGILWTDACGVMTRELLPGSYSVLVEDARGEFAASASLDVPPATAPGDGPGITFDVVLR